MKIITLSNTKGGVGKTTASIHIAAGLAMRGYKVLLIDADPQGHATFTLGINKEPCFHDLLVRNAPFDKMVRSVETKRYATPDTKVTGALFLIPSNVETRSITNHIEDVFLLQNRLLELDGQIDVVVIDTSPTPSMLHGSIYLASDYILYPTSCELLSLEGLGQSMAQRQNASKARTSMGYSPLDMMGILPTMYRSGTSVHNYNLEQLHKSYGELVWKPTSLRTAWADATQMGYTIFAMNADPIALRQAWEVVDNVQGHLT
jgi:chromosome partitioning protein